MTQLNRHLVMALAISTTLVVLNIIAVTQSSGENYYRVLEQFIIRLIS